MESWGVGFHLSHLNKTARQLRTEDAWDQALRCRGKVAPGRVRLLIGLNPKTFQQ